MISNNIQVLLNNPGVAKIVKLIIKPIFYFILGTQTVSQLPWQLRGAIKMVKFIRHWVVGKARGLSRLGEKRKHM